VKLGSTAVDPENPLSQRKVGISQSVQNNQGIDGRINWESTAGYLERGMDVTISLGDLFHIPIVNLIDLIVEIPYTSRYNT